MSASHWPKAGAEKRGVLGTDGHSISAFRSVSDSTLKIVLTTWGRLVSNVPTVKTRKPRARYDVERIVADMALKGWMGVDLARAAGVSSMTVTRFLRGEAQTARTAERLARALGYTVRRYFVSVEAVA